MKLFERYLQKSQTYVDVCFPDDVALIVIIPVYDDPDIFVTLDSLAACDMPKEGRVGILIVVNHSEMASEEIKERNELLYAQIRTYTEQTRFRDLEISTIKAFDLPAKEAGVGLARKWAMDSAVAYYARQKNENGIIVSLDADTLTDKNYFTALLEHFSDLKIAGAAIAYEHRLEGGCDSIVKYELYLRYYCKALEYMLHPYAFHCIGSAFAVRTKDYVAVGGMNKRQAGEDFYFIQKLIASNRFTHLFSTKVYPSSRVSERTPFGTGRAVKAISESNGSWPTYHMEAFKELKSFFDSIEDLFKKEQLFVFEFIDKQVEPIRSFLLDNDFGKSINEINKNTASVQQFKRRFFDTFNAFRVLKYLNYVHPRYYQKQEITDAVKLFAEEVGWEVPDDAWEALVLLRKMSEKSINSNK
ncbi:hypothetical protein LJB85_01345 [Porphyromonadaceae bacterium OttesenSCG-928-L07]|nr:hypothetical protein [Porphyromonadaceae bacterium OttesenSCG-928-L07]